MRNDGKKRKVTFTMEVTLDLNIEFSYVERYNEIELGLWRILLKDRDIYNELPPEILNQIEEAIMEEIQDDQKDS